MTDEKIGYLIKNMRKRYNGKGDLTIGALLFFAGQKLITRYYKRHKNNPQLLELRDAIKINLSNFQEDLNEYKIQLK